ncbi:MAG: 50S ribosomal protein L10 [Candidatus Campbellbacteria bacterium]|nr:50S ribosomal protein L10 [Candidatus Campbellbacteria bacterium]
MAITRDKKKEVAKTVEDILDNSSTVVFVNFKGLGVEDSTKMRHDLREKSVGYYVAKKTLIHRALDNKSFEGEKPPLEGEIALAYSEDHLAPAREIYEFGKGLGGALSIVGGVFDGVYYDRSSMVDIATIPSRETLLTQFVNVINSPIQGFASALHQIAETREA